MYDTFVRISLKTSENYMIFGCYEGCKFMKEIKKVIKINQKCVFN